MTMIVIALLFSLVMFGIALKANAQFHSEDCLPMQWRLTGEVTWHAPRAIALAFVPVLAFIVFLSLILLSFNRRPRLGQEGMVLPTLIGIGLLLLAIQLLHLWLVKKTLHRNSR